MAPNFPYDFLYSLIGYENCEVTFGLFTSVQAEKIKIAYPTFLDAWDLRSNLAGHFCL